MGQISLLWEAFEIETPGVLREYLIRNCEKMYNPVPVLGAKKGEKIGEVTRYEFRDLRDVVLQENLDGSGGLTVFGKDSLDERFEKLKRLIGYKSLEPIRK